MDNLNLNNNQESFEAFDLLEQHQAQEQARLLKRFRELREWQQQQQQQLMQQQQHQLLSLQSDQNKVQSLLAAQRGLEPNFHGAMRPGSPILTPPTKKTIPSKSNQFRQQQQQLTEPGLSYDSGLVMSMQDTLKSQNSLPKPVMYIHPNQINGAPEEDKYTNSELFSNMDSPKDDMVLEGETHQEPPYPDWMSDASENFLPPKLPPPRLMKSQLLSCSNRDQLAGLEELLNTAPPALLHQVLSLLPGHASALSKTPGNHEVEQSASPALPVSAVRPQNFHVEHRNSQASEEMDPQVFRRMDDFDVRYAQKSQMESSNGFDPDGYYQNVHSDNRSFDDNADEYNDLEDEDEDDSPREEKETDQERPIQGTHGFKSFEQLLEEQLQSEGVAIPAENVDQQKTDESVRPRNFLRKGEGIARFNSAPERRPKPRHAQKDRNRPASVRTGRDAAGDRNAAQGVKRIQAGVTKDREGQTKDMVGKHLPPAPKKNPKLQRQEPDQPSKPSSHLSLIHNVAQRRKEIQKGVEEEQVPSTVKMTPARSEGRRQKLNSVSDQSPSIDGISSATDEHDLTELDSLAEFELLEDAADNMSFCSNSSLVKKLVCLDQQSHKEAVKRLKSISDSKKQNKDNSLPTHAMRREAAPPIMTDTAPDNAMFFTASDNKSNSNSNAATNTQPTVLDEFRDFVPYFSTQANGNITDEGSSDAITLVNTLVKPKGVYDEHFGFPKETTSDPKTSSSPVSPSNIPRAIFLNYDGGSVTSPPPSPPSTTTSAMTMTRKIAPISSKFTEANDTLSLLKALSQKAGLLTYGADSRQPESKNESTANFPAAEDISRKSFAYHNSASTRHSQSAFITDQLKQVSSTDIPQTLSQMFSQSTMPNLTFGPNMATSTAQSSDDDSKFFSFSTGNDPWRGPNFGQKDLSVVAEEIEDGENDNDDEEDEEDDEDDSDTCESSGDEANDTLKAKDIGKNISSITSQWQQAFIPFQRLAPESSKGGSIEHKFDDDAAWTEESKEECGDERERVGHAENKTEAIPHALSETSSSVPTKEVFPSSPPTSGLVSKLFPKLKPPPPPQAIQIPETATASRGNMVDGTQSRVLRDKLKELDNEIERFRSENARLNKLRREREEGLDKLKQEISTFQKEKEEELKRFENFKTQELKKFKREKKQFDNYQKKMRSMPAKKEKEEIDVLNAQLEELQDELKRKELRWTSSTARLKNRLSELETENGELKEEIRIMEKKRLEWMSQPRGSKATNQNGVKSSTGEATRSSSEMPVYKSTTASDQRENIHESNRTSKAFSTPATNSLVNQGSSNHYRLDSTSNVPQVKSSANGTLGDGAPVQNNFIPVMAENTLMNQKSVATDLSLNPVKVPPAPINSHANGPRLESTPTTEPSTTKSAALVAMEKTVIDKGDLRKCKETKHKDGKVEKIFETGAKEIYFPNGTVKEISPDGQTIVCGLANGDIRQIFPDHRVVYIFAEAQIMQTSFPDGLEMFHFKNGQIEKRYPDGTVEITFPSNDIKYLFPDGGQEVILTDGTVMQYSSKGERTVDYPSGDREVHTAEYQRREFPDGIVKTIYADGRHETRFPNGRVRLRDKAGNIIMDQICSS